MTMKNTQQNPFSETEKRFIHEIIRERNTVLKKFPLLFTMLGAFGLVATFYGFEHIIDNIPLLVDNPILLLLIGILTLTLTGTLYKKLG